MSMGGAALTPYTFQFFTAVTGCASFAFTNSGQNLGVHSTTAVRLGDVDGDGDPDALLANVNPDRLCMNDGTGLFSDSGQFVGLRIKF